MSIYFEEPNCRDCNLVFSTVFKKLTVAQLDYLSKNKVCSQIKKGKTLYKEGSRITGVYCINDGILKVYKTGCEGKEQIVKFAKKGDIIGYRSVINGEPACTSVKAIEDSIVCYINTQELYGLLKENSELGIELLQIACAELDEANNYLTDIAQKSVRERLAEILLKLQNDFGTNKEGIINITLTREELANIIGTATESVIRLLSEFRNEGLVDLQGRKVKILNIQKLKKISNVFK